MLTCVCVDVFVMFGRYRQFYALAKTRSGFRLGICTLACVCVNFADFNIFPRSEFGNQRNYI